MSWLTRRHRRLEFKKRQVPLLRKRRFDNPLFQKKSQKEGFNGRGKYYFIILLISLGYFIFFSGYFIVDSVIVEGTHYLSEERIKPIVENFLQSRSWIIFPQNNLVLTGLEKLTTDISNNLANEFALSSLNVSKDYPSSIKIEVTERVPSLTWVSNNITFYIDRSGRITKRLDEDEVVDENFPKIYDLENRVAQLNQEVIAPDEVTFLFATWQEFGEKFPEQKVDSFHYNQAELPDVWLMTEADWKIYLDSLRDPVKQIDESYLIYQEYFSEDPNRLNYIDVRLSDRAYYKTRY